MNLVFHIVENVIKAAQVWNQDFMNIFRKYGMLERKLWATTLNIFEHQFMLMKSRLLKENDKPPL